MNRTATKSEIELNGLIDLNLKWTNELELNLTELECGPGNELNWNWNWAGTGLNLTGLNWIEKDWK